MGTGKALFYLPLVVAICCLWMTFNQVVARSSRAGRTNKDKGLRESVTPFSLSERSRGNIRDDKFFCVALFDSILETTDPARALSVTLC